MQGFLGGVESAGVLYGQKYLPATFLDRRWTVAGSRRIPALGGWMHREYRRSARHKDTVRIVPEKPVEIKADMLRHLS